MAGILWRVLLVVIMAVLVQWGAPALLRILGLDLSGDVLTVIKVCLAGIAIFYILRGATPSWSRP